MQDRWQTTGIFLVAMGLVAVFVAGAAEARGLVVTLYDPQMAYFFDSLAVFRGRPYAFIGHPGTPLEVIGTLLFTLTVPFLWHVPEGFVSYHVAHPEVFQLLGSVFLTAGTVATVILITRRLPLDWGSGAPGRLLPLALAVTYFVSLPKHAYLSLVYWSHNSFGFLAGSSLLVVLFVCARSEPPLVRRRALLVGFLAGILTAVQLYFAAWVVGTAVTFAVLAHLRREPARAALLEPLRVAAASIVGFLVATLPIVPEYPQFFRWVGSLITHQGVYGRGERGFTSPAQVVENAGALWSAAPTTISLAAGAIVLLITAMAGAARRGRWVSWWALAWGMLAQLAALALLLLKHPSGIYLLSVAATLPFVLALALPLVAHRSRAGRLIVAGASVLILASFSRGLWLEVRHVRETGAWARETSAAIDTLLDRYARALDRPRQRLTVFWGNGLPSPCFGYRMGVWRQPDLYGDVDRLCPNQWTLEVFGDAKVPNVTHMLAGSVDWDVLVVPVGHRSLPRPVRQLGEPVHLDLRRAGMSPRKGKPIVLVFRDRARAPKSPP